MLTKLLKHEYKATAKTYLLILIAITITTILFKISYNIDIEGAGYSFVKGLFGFTYVASAIGGIAIGVIYVVIRFYKNLVTDEGYLTFTLPVSTGQIIISKLIPAVTWIVITILIGIASTFALRGDVNAIDALYTQIGNGIDEVLANGKLTAFAASLLIYLLISVITSILLAYVSIATGQIFPKSKIIGSCISYFVYYFIANIIMAIMIVIVTIATGNVEMFGVDTSITEFANVGILIFVIASVTSIITSVVYYKLTKHMFTKRLNLE